MRAYRLAIALICGAAAFAAAPAAKAGFFGEGCGTCGGSVGYGGYGYGAGYGGYAAASPVYSLGYGAVADCGGGCGYGGYGVGGYGVGGYGGYGVGGYAAGGYGAVGFGTGCGHCGTAVLATPGFVGTLGQYYPYVSGTDFYNRSYYSGGPYGNPLGHGYGYGRGYGGYAGYGGYGYGHAGYGYGHGGYGYGHGGYGLGRRVDYTYGSTGPRVVSVGGYYGPRYRVRHEAAYRPAPHYYRGGHMPMMPAYK